MRCSTRFLILCALLAVLPLTAPTAYAGEPGLLEQLEAETTKLAERARVATVLITAGGVSSEAVLVGSPPRLVTAFVPIGHHEEVEFSLPGAAGCKARRVAGERELDIAVYELSEFARSKAKALAVEDRWDLPAGRLAVLGGKEPRLLLTRSTRGPRDGVRVGDEDTSGILVGADGRLLAFRPRVFNPPGYYVVQGLQGSTFTTSYATLAPQRLVEAHVPVTGPDGVIRYWKPPKKEEKPDRSVKGHVTDKDGRPLQILVAPSVRHVTYPTPTKQPTSVLTPKRFLPAALIHRVLEDLEAHGHVRHAYLGVVPAAPDKGYGAKLVTVLPDSPAAKAGLVVGDVVILLNGHNVANAAAFTRALVLRRPGEKITLSVLGRKVPVHVVLGAQKEARRELPTPAGLGLEVVPLTPELRIWLDMEDAEQGVAVCTVTPNSAAAKAGLKRGDVILKGADQPTRDVEELLAALAGAKQRIVLTVRSPGRKGKHLLSLTLPAAKPGAGPR